MWIARQQTPTELLTLQIFSKYFLNYCWQISDETLISVKSIGCCQSTITQPVIGPALRCDSEICFPILAAEKWNWENLSLTQRGRELRAAPSPGRAGGQVRNTLRWDCRKQPEPGEVSPLLLFVSLETTENCLFSVSGKRQMLLLFRPYSTQCRRGRVVSRKGCYTIKTCN